MPEETTQPEAPKEAPKAKVNLDNFNHCFRCGAGAEYGAKLKVVGNEKVCLTCRKAEVEKDLDE